MVCNAVFHAVLVQRLRMMARNAILKQCSGIGWPDAWVVRLPDMGPRREGLFAYWAIMSCQSRH